MECQYERNQANCRLDTFYLQLSLEGSELNAIRRHVGEPSPELAKLQKATPAVSLDAQLSLLLEACVASTDLPKSLEAWKLARVWQHDWIHFSFSDLTWDLSSKFHYIRLHLIASLFLCSFLDTQFYSYWWLRNPLLRFFLLLLSCRLAIIFVVVGSMVASSIFIVCSVLRIFLYDICFDTSDRESLVVIRCHVQRFERLQDSPSWSLLSLSLICHSPMLWQHW